MIKGYIDNTTTTAIYGWAADSSSLSKPLELKLVINNNSEVLFTANVYRPDVMKAIGSGEHGFYIPLTGKLTTGNNTLQIKTLDGKPLFSEKQVVADTTSNNQMVEHGNDGWLFLKNDSNKNNDFLDGTLTLPEQKLISYQRLFFIREMMAKNFKFRLLNIVVPDKNVVCNHHKKNPLNISANRPALEILKRVKGTTSTVFYPLTECSGHDELYFKTDTHLSYVGQRKLFDLILEKINVKPMYRVTTQSNEFFGDLGMKLTPAAKETVFKISPQYRTTKVLDTALEAIDKGIRLTDTWSHHIGKTGTPKRVYVFGTSTAYHLRELFFSQFQDVLFTWHTSMDLDTIRKYKPDYVVGIISERFLTQVPDDNSTQLTWA